MSNDGSEVRRGLHALEDADKRLETKTTQLVSTMQEDIMATLRKLDSEVTQRDASVRKALLSIENLKVTDHGRIENSETSRHLFEGLAKFVTTARIISRDQGVLESLCFPTMTVRELNVSDAHSKTFDWILSDKNEGESNIQTHLMDWLETQSGVYWIMGKAGSGKSTLMKFLNGHPRTQEALTKWADDKKLLTANFFFWNAGNTAQKSQEGLLRSLLFQILRQCPSMIPKVCLGWVDTGTFWTKPRLLECFKRLKTQTQSTHQFCFFIDGLDEYKGEPTDLVEALRNLSSSSMIKICVSSRPWSIFRDAFGQSPRWMLRLEDLTRGDIALYVQDKFESHQRFKYLRDKDVRYQGFVEQIVNKSAGVFLWVYLVTKSILKGLTHADRITDLERRLRLLPADLETYFRQILDSVEDVYRNQMFKTFQYALHALPGGPIPLEVFYHLDEIEESDIPLCSDISSGFNSISLNGVRQEEMQRRLDGRTKGLLEVTSRLASPRAPTPIVDFLHRTVMDFLRTNEIQKLLGDGVGSTFDPHYDLYKAFLAFYKSDLDQKHLATFHTERLLYHARQFRSQTDKRQTTAMVNKLERLLSEDDADCMKARVTFTQMLIYFNFTSDVKQRLEAAPEYLLKTNIPLLLVALTWSNMLHIQGTLFPDPEMVHVLLDKGADPNEVYEKGKFRRTVWADFLSITYRYWIRRTQLDNVSLLQVSALLLSYGADPNAKVEENLSATAVIEKIFPDDAVWLLSGDLSRSSPRSDEDSAQYLEVKATSPHYLLEWLTSKSLIVFLTVIAIVIVRSQR